MGRMKDFDRRIRQGGDDAIAAVSELMASRWIPVEERLPEEGVRVLVCNTYGGSLPNQGDTGYVVDNGVMEGEEWCITDDPFFHVTHWMPLPEPPEVE